MGRQIRQGLRVNLADLPTGEARVLYADPPWRFSTYDKKGKVPQRAAVQHYPTMTREELLALAPEIGRVAHRDCVLIMWTTSSNLAEAIALGQGWGFTYKSLAFVWVKTLKKVDQMGFFPAEPSYRMSLGHWTRQQSEIALLFTRGKPKRIGKGVRQIIAEPRREHSRKPDDVIRRIEELTAGPYLELFARTKRPGWSTAGNETEKFKGGDA